MAEWNLALEAWTLRHDLLDRFPPLNAIRGPARCDDNEGRDAELLSGDAGLLVRAERRRRGPGVLALGVVRGQRPSSQWGSRFAAASQRRKAAIALRKPVKVATRVGAPSAG